MSLLRNQLAAALRKAAIRQGVILQDGDSNPPLNSVRVGPEADEIRAALQAYDAQEISLTSTELLVHAYARGESRGGSVDWDDLNQAWQQAKIELGERRVEEIESCYIEPDIDGPDTGEDDGHPVAT